MTAAAWSVKPNWWYFRNDVAKGYGPSTGSGSFPTGCGCWYWPSRNGSGRSTTGHKTKASAGRGTPWRGLGNVASVLLQAICNASSCSSINDCGSRVVMQGAHKFGDVQDYTDGFSLILKCFCTFATSKTNGCGAK